MAKRSGLKILLIEPPFHRLFKNTYSLDRFPNGLVNLAGSILDQTDWDVLVYNADYSGPSIPTKCSYLTGAGFDNYLKRQRDLNDIVWQEVKTVIAKNNPDVVGISAKSPNFVSACNVAKLAKEIDPKITVIVGGPHPSLPGVDPFECNDIDIVVRGEGELTIVELLERIQSNAPLDGVQGISYKMEGRVFENGPRPLISNLDRLRFPHETAEKVLVNHDDYPISSFRHVYTTRGCPFNCFFCGSREMWGRKVRFRSPENVVSEIQGLQAEGLRHVQFQDDTFGIDRDYLKRLCDLLIRHCPGLKWSCLTHVKLVNEDTMSLMKAAGCKSIHIGIESGNNDILRKIRKNFTIQEALAACDTIKECGTEVLAFFMVGYPQETEDTLAETIDVMKKGKFHRIIYSIFTPHPGTEAYQYCAKNHLVSKNFDVRLYNHQSPMNYFCPKIPQARFRTIASEIERMVDKQHFLSRAKQLFTITGLQQIRELGIRHSLSRANRLFIEERFL